MGQPVVHFEVAGKDSQKLHGFYSGLFGWEFDTANPMGYGLVAREDNLSAEGIGIGGGIGQAPEGYDGHLTFYVAVPDVEAALKQVESLGGARVMGPDEVMGRMTVALFADPEGHLVGLVSGG